MSEDRLARMKNQIQSKQDGAALAIANNLRTEAANASSKLQSLIDRANSGATSQKVDGDPYLVEFRHYFIWGKSTWGLDNTTSSPSGSATLLDRGTLSSGDRGGVYRSLNSSGER